MRTNDPATGMLRGATYYRVNPRTSGNDDSFPHLHNTLDRLTVWTIQQAIVHSSSKKRFNMSSTLLKVAFAGAVTAGALFLPVTAAEAATKNFPCDGPGFGHGGFFGHGFGHGFGAPYFGNRFGFYDSGFGFYDEPPAVIDNSTVIVVTVPVKNHHKPVKHHRPTGGGSGGGSGDGYHRGNVNA
jgi:hypothetical protein